MGEGGGHSSDEVLISRLRGVILSKGKGKLASIKELDGGFDGAAFYVVVACVLLQLRTIGWTLCWVVYLTECCKY